MTRPSIQRARARWVFGRAASLGATLLAALGGAGPTADAQDANHLVISEVCYKPATQTSGNAAGSAEYIEIFNPTAQSVDLNLVYLSDFADQYWLVSDFNVLGGTGNAIRVTSADFVYRFPAGAALPPGGTAIVCGDSASFLAEFFAGNLATFRATGAQLFECVSDGAGDGVADLLIVSNTGSNLPPPRTFSLTDGGECAILYRWDGFSDLIDDLDFVTWQRDSALNGSIGTNGGELIDKTGQSVSSSGGAPSNFLADAKTVLGVARAPGGAGNNNFAAPEVTIVGHSIIRSKRVETSEVLAGGNGLTGHDESTENFADTFIDAVATPGVPHPGLGVATAQLPQAPLLDLGDVPFGGTGTGTLRVNNTGTAVLVVRAINVSGAQSSRFVVDTTGLPLVVAAGGGIDIDIDFTASASAPGSNDIQVEVQTNDATTPNRSINVTARSVEAPAIAVTSAAIQQGAIRFTSAVVGSNGSSAVITIANAATNPAAADLRVTSFVFSPAGGAFSIDNASSVSIVRGQPINRTIFFRPGVAGTFNGTLTIASNDPQQPVQVINLTGQGVDFGRGGGGSSGSDRSSGGGGGCAVAGARDAGSSGLALLALLIAGLVAVRRRVDLGRLVPARR